MWLDIAYSLMDVLLPFIKVDQLQLDLGNEKALSNKAESARSQIDKQNKELKLRLSELEEVARKGNKNQISALESKVK